VISFIVIAASLVLAAVYVLAWIFRPGFRQAIERPKYWFQDELDRYDQRVQNERDESGANGR
jgi:di/tricarboxylate transporter